jgi:hypothetical protein
MLNDTTFGMAKRDRIWHRPKGDRITPYYVLSWTRCLRMKSDRLFSLSPQTLALFALERLP